MSDKDMNKDTVDVLACYANLPLTDARKQAMLPILQSWLPAANALSTRMARDEVRQQIPVTVFGFGTKN